MNSIEFKQIAGYKDEIKELQDLSNVLKQGKTLLENGFRFPRGLLILGEPGVGKSVMAESLIHDAHLYCVRIDIETSDGFSLSKYLEDKFKEAKAMAPSIIFIDELDKICGENSYFGPSYDNDKVRKLIKAINENQDDNIMLLATANENRMIGSALRRSGRFDRVINIPYPNMVDRKEILQLYLKNKELDKSVSISSLVRLTDSFTGADIECLVNEAGINAQIENRKTIKATDFTKAINRMIFEGIPRNSNLNKGDLMVVATHEAGHIVSTLLLRKNVIEGASINPTGAVQGHVINSKEEKRLLTKETVLKQVVIALSGKAAEKMIDNNDFIGSSEDFEYAYHLVMRLVSNSCCYGFEYGMFDHHTDRVSNQKKAMVEQKCCEILKECYDRAYKLMSDNIPLLRTFSMKLFKKYSLSREEILKIYEKFKKENGKQ